MKTKSIILSILMLCAISGYSQSYSIMAFKGGVFTVGTSGDKALGYATKLTNSTKIKINNGGYLALMHSSGKTLELKTAGTFDVKSLNQKLTAKSSSFTKKYGDFVLGEMTKTDVAKSNHYVTGSVTRGGNDQIKIYGINQSRVLKNGTLYLRWDFSESYKATMKNSPDAFIVEVFDTEESVVFSKKVKGFTTAVDLSNLELDEDEESYIVRIVEDKPESKDIKENDPKIAILIVEEDEAETITTELNELKDNLDLTASALDNLFMAKFLIEQRMFTQAAEYYEKAVELAPGVESYEKARETFLIKMDVIDKRSKK